MARFPHGGEVLGAAPANPLLAPVLRPGRDLNRQQAMLDLAAIQRIPGIAGYWPADPAYLFEDSAGTIPASVGGVVGCWWSLGPAAIQATTAVKPYLRKTPRSSVYWLDSNTDPSALTATLGNLGAACTVAQAGAEGVTFTEGVTISSTYNIATAFGFNSDIAIFNRALTVTEKALLTRYMQRGVPVLSAEYVANGEFDSSAAWTLQSGVTIENGKLVYNDAYVVTENSNSFTGGLYYLIKSKALTVTSRAYCIATASVSALSQDISTAGTYSEMLYVGDTSKIHVRAREGAGTYTIDYVSVRAVL